MKKCYEERKDKNKITVVVDSSFTVSGVEAFSSDNGEIEDDPQLQLKKKTYQDIIEFLENLEPNTKMQELTEQRIFGRKMEVYLINP